MKIHVDKESVRIVTDDLCDKVYVASYLGKVSSEEFYAGIGKVYSSVKAVLAKHGITLRELSNTMDIWARDYMPVQITENRFWEYTYDPDYLIKGDNAKYITDYRDVTFRGKKLFPDAHRIPIVADGGNIVKCDDFVIMTDKVFSEAERKGYELSLDNLCESLGIDVVIIPHDSAEPFGHADGMVHWIAPNKVLFRAAQDEEDREFMNDVIAQFKRQKPDVDVVQFDFSTVAKQCKYNWAYINFLRVGNVILLPKLSTEDEFVAEDDIALAQLQTLLPDCIIEWIPMRKFLKSGGGALNCISWTVKG